MIIKQLKNVGPETWIMLAGALFLIIVIIVAMVPGETGFGSAASHTPVQSRPSGAAVNGPMPQNRTVAQMQPVQTLPIFSYGGVVDQAVNRDPGGWGQVHILVNDGAGLTQEVSLAPEWYLQFQGCLVQRGQHVTGEGFHFDSVNRGGLLYAKNVIVNGVRCRLRSVEGLALWSDQLR
ncbi:MAG: hypothetical protein ABW185_10080 [Sedimenticola sp.]